MTVTLPTPLLEAADEALSASGLANRSRLVRAALHAYLRGLRDEQLAAEAAKLDADEEEGLAEEGLVAAHAAWDERDA